MTTADRPQHRVRRRPGGPESNARLTASVAAVLVILLAAEGFTILRVGRLLTPHVFIGMLLVPPVLLKMGSTMWRFVRYYAGDEEYRRKGPPLPLLRLLGPVVVVLTVVVFGTGIALLLGPYSFRSQMLQLHQLSFILWFGAMTIHVLGHIVETARVAPTGLDAAHPHPGGRRRGPPVGARRQSRAGRDPGHRRRSPGRPVAGAVASHVVAGFHR